jgi:hypothetical protein
LHARLEDAHLLEELIPVPVHPLVLGLMSGVGSRPGEWRIFRSAHDGRGSSQPATGFSPM